MVGDVLASHPGCNAVVVTKAGYVTPSVGAQLIAAGVAEDVLSPISDDSWYSLAPDVLRFEIALSRQRLHRSNIDILLLHNPEHLLDGPRAAEGKSYETTLRRAFELLEELARAHVIGGYGVSSNTLHEIRSDGRKHLDQLMAVASEVSSPNHFYMAEFPFNFRERAAVEQEGTARTVLESLQQEGVVSVANRALTTTRNGQIVRFATYDRTSSCAVNDNPEQTYRECVSAVELRLNELGEGHRAMDFTVMQFLRDNWSGVGNPELVDAIFARHVDPFLHALFGSAVPPPTQDLFLSLRSHARRFALRELSKTGTLMRDDLVRSGLVAGDDPRPLATLAAEYPLQVGIDHVVIGMRNTEYVDDFVPLFHRDRPA